MSMFNWFKTNIAIKVWSILLAIVVWNVIHREISIEKTYNAISLDLQIPKDMVVLKKNFRKLQIRIKGPYDVIRDTREDAIQVKYDLSSVDQSGAISFQLTPEDFEIPARIQVTEIQPYEITVVLDRLIVKTLEVKPIMTDKPMMGYAVKEVRVGQSYLQMNYDWH